MYQLPFFIHQLLAHSPARCPSGPRLTARRRPRRTASRRVVAGTRAPAICGHPNRPGLLQGMPILRPSRPSHTRRRFPPVPAARTMTGTAASPVESGSDEQVPAPVSGATRTTVCAAGGRQAPAQTEDLAGDEHPARRRRPHLADGQDAGDVTPDAGQPVEQGWEFGEQVVRALPPSPSMAPGPPAWGARRRRSWGRGRGREKSGGAGQGSWGAAPAAALLGLVVDRWFAGG